MILVGLLGVCIGLLVGYFIFNPNFKKKSGGIKVIGTLMIPSREEELLKKVGKDLSLFVSEPGKGSSNHIYAVQGSDISESSYGGFSGSTPKKVLWGASFKKTNEKQAINCICIPGDFVEGTVTGAFQIEEDSRFRPCLVNVILY